MATRVRTKAGQVDQTAEAATDKTLTWLYLSLDGRIGRRTFWLRGVLAVIAAMVFLQMAELILFELGAPSALLFLLTLLQILPIWSLIALQVKRWHDRDKSGWWILINFIPVAGLIAALIVLGFLPGTPGPNRFGPEPS